MLVPFEEHFLGCQVCPERLQEIEVFATICRKAAFNIQQREPSPWQKLAGSFFVVPKPVWAAAFAALIIAAIVPNLPSRVEAGRQIVNLKAFRGSETALVLQAFHKKVIELRIDTTELPALPTYRLELVNSAGRQKWESLVQIQNHLIEAVVPRPLSSGKYWVRLYAPGVDGDLIREFGLEISAP